MVEGLLSKQRWEALFENSGPFFEGLFMTLKVAVAGLILALLLGVILGLMSTSKSKVLRGLARVYIEFFQGTPLVIQVFFYYNGLPLILKTILNTSRPVRISKFLLGTMGGGLYHGAYIAEVIRTGIEGVPKGQIEAAHSQGFTNIQTMRFVVLPQTLKMIYPPLANQALNLVKNTSVLALVAGLDLMYYSDNWVSQTSYLQGYILSALLYFMICFPLARLAHKLEEKSKQTPVEKKKMKVEVS
ncbi:MAG: amino acid ABC transporter permease [Anaerocolumna sp.]